MNVDPDDMFSRAGLAVFLSQPGDVGSGKWSHRPRVSVYVGDFPRPVYVTEDDLTCRSCGGPFDLPSNPAKWIAVNKVLNDGRCRSCGG